MHRICKPPSQPPTSIRHSPEHCPRSAILVSAACLGGKVAHCSENQMAIAPKCPGLAPCTPLTPRPLELICLHAGRQHLRYADLVELWASVPRLPGRCRAVRGLYQTKLWCRCRLDRFSRRFADLSKPGPQPRSATVYCVIVIICCFSSRWYFSLCRAQQQCASTQTLCI